MRAGPRMVYLVPLVILALPGVLVWLGTLEPVRSSLLPEHYRTSFTSGVILALVVLCVLNAAVLVGWAMTDDRDLNGNAIRPPVFRVVSVLAAAALLVLGVGQLRLRTRG